MIVYRHGAGASVGDVHSCPTLSRDGKKSKNLCRGGVSPPDSKGENFCSQGERSHFEGTSPPSKGFLLTFCPRRQKVTKNAFGVRVNAEVGLQSQPTSIACQRYHTPNSPHLRHGRPPRCSLVDFHRPNWSNKGQKEGREAFCPFYMGYRKTFGCANATPKILLPKSSWGFGGFFQEAPKRTPVLLR